MTKFEPSEDVVSVQLNEDGVPHCEKGPAMELKCGTHVWMLHGELHRLDGPAIESPDGFKAYYCGGVRHRVDGPALIIPTGESAYFYYGYFAENKDIFNNAMWRKEIILKCSGLDTAEFKSKYKEVYGDEFDDETDEDD